MPRATTGTADQVKEQVSEITTKVIAALEDPAKVIPRLALYDTAEEKDRHTEYGVSILAYALAGYVQSHFEVPARYEVQITPLDSSVMISAQNKNPKRAEKDRFQQEVPYPMWLASFFEDDEMFAYLTPGDDTPLEEVIANLEAHVEDLAVDAEPDAGDEDDEDETEEDTEDDDDPDEEDEADQEETTEDTGDEESDDVDDDDDDDDDEDDDDEDDDDELDDEDDDDKPEEEEEEPGEDEEVDDAEDEDEEEIDDDETDEVDDADITKL